MKKAPESADSVPPAPPGQIFFVQEGFGGKQRSKQSRAHVARVNRQRQKLKSIANASGQSGSDGSSSSSSSSASSPSGDKAALAAENAQQNELAQRPKRKSVPKNPVRRTSKTSNPLAVARRTHSAPSVPQTVSPVFGALASECFEPRQSVDTADIANYCFGTIMETWLPPEYKPAWIAAFFQLPLVHHSLSYSCGVLQDVSNNRPVQERRLIHKIKTIHLLNAQLNDLNNANIEAIMLAIITLWRINTDAIEERKAVPLLLSPHLRSASWVALFGKLGGDGSHARALVQLVQRIGGLGNFGTLPSLQESIALADVLDSSAHASRPKFESIWDAEFFLNLLQPTLKSLEDDSEGRGFARYIPGGLPNFALLALQRLAAQDKLLDNFANGSVERSEEYFVATLGNAVQHQLLSLRPWQQLSEDEREASFHATYEAARIASVIYSNAVIFPMTPSEEWLEKLLIQLKQLVETSDMAMWDTDTTPLLTWSLFTGGMAAFWTSHRTFFVKTLRTTLKSSGLTAWSDVKALMQEFLWRDGVCEHGAAILWEFLRLDQPDT